jgi:hypothetical protein
LDKVVNLAMAKLRELSSIEAALSNAIKNAKEKILLATGKSESYLRKCSDPSLPQQLDHSDAIKIDKACIESGLMPYLFEAHKSIIISELKKIKTSDHDLNELLVKFTILHGQLMESINSAKSTTGDQGAKITSAEKKEIFEAFDKLETKILKIKKAIEVK